MDLLQIYQWVCQWKNFENRLTFGEVMGKSLVSCFFWDTVYILLKSALSATQGSHSLGYKKSRTFPGPQRHFPGPGSKPPMFKYRDKQQLLTIYIHHKAEKKNQFSFVNIFFNTWQKLVNFFTYIEESISYNSVYLILACVKNFTVTATLNVLCLPVK